MKVYTVHAPPGGDRDPAALAERLVFVKDGFSWPALLVAPLWAAWHRLWFALLVWLAAVLAIGAAATLTAAGEALALVAFVFALWFAAQANDFRRAALERGGWAPCGIATGRDLAECEHALLARWIAGASPVPARRAAARSPAAAPRGGETDEPVVGLFPRPGMGG